MGPKVKIYEDGEEYYIEEEDIYEPFPEEDEEESPEVARITKAIMKGDTHVLRRRK